MAESSCATKRIERPVRSSTSMDANERSDEEEDDALP